MPATNPNEISTAIKVTVLMPVYNAECYLREAIESIIDQTFAGYKFLIINDGSTDNSENIIQSFDDGRIQYIKHERNRGLIATLNEGFELATSEYIVRMDADDISLLQRIERQVAFMDLNPDIAISGTWLSVINSGHVIAHPRKTDECKIKLLKDTVLGHPSVILRRAAVNKSEIKFSTDSLHAEDYRFWVDAAIAGLKIANIPEVLVEYRVHDEQVSALGYMQQRETGNKIKLSYGQKFFNDLIADKTDLYMNLVNGSVTTFTDLKKAELLVEQLKEENKHKKYFDINTFNNFLDELLTAAVSIIYVQCADCNLQVLGRSMFDSNFYKATNLIQKARYIFRAFQKAFSWSR